MTEKFAVRAILDFRIMSGDENSFSFHSDLKIIALQFTQHTIK
jgi:hypothetical protein